MNRERVEPGPDPRRHGAQSHLSAAEQSRIADYYEHLVAGFSHLELLQLVHRLLSRLAELPAESATSPWRTPGMEILHRLVHDQHAGRDGLLVVADTLIRGAMSLYQAERQHAEAEEETNA